MVLTGKVKIKKPVIGPNIFYRYLAAPDMFYPAFRSAGYPVVQMCGKISARCINMTVILFQLF